MMCLIILMSCVICTNGQVRMPRFFGDGMVLQRDVKIPIWGWSNPGSCVEVSLNGNVIRTCCDSEGKWKLLRK